MEGAWRGRVLRIGAVGSRGGGGSGSLLLHLDPPSLPPDLCPPRIAEDVCAAILANMAERVDAVCREVMGKGAADAYDTVRGGARLRRRGGWVGREDGSLGQSRRQP